MSNTANASPSALALTVGAAGRNASTVGVVTSSADPSLLGQPVTLSVGVGDTTNVAMTGTVSFFDGATFLGYGAFDMMTSLWRLTTSTLGSGSHSITVTYGGNFFYAPGA